MSDGGPQRDDGLGWMILVLYSLPGITTCMATG